MTRPVPVTPDELEEMAFNSGAEITLGASSASLVLPDGRRYSAPLPDPALRGAL